MDDDLFVEIVITMKKDLAISFTSKMNTIVKELENSFNELILMEKNITDLDIAVVADTVEEYDKNVFSMFSKIRSNLPAGPEHHIYLYKQPVKYGFKWVLKGPGAKRPIDFFKVWTPPHVLLHRFHLNIVRFWWDGRRLKALASAVCAALTGVNQWYRWFSNNKDPIDIVFKYMQRGYTTLLNNREIDAMKVYMSEVNKYKYLTTKFTTGKIHQQHTIFGHRGGIRYELPKVFITSDQYIDTPQYWPNPTYTLNRLGCLLKTNSRGKIIAPKWYAFEPMISDLLD